MNRRGFLIGSATLPLALSALPAMAVAGRTDFVMTGPQWMDNIYYLKMRHYDFRRVERYRRSHREYPVDPMLIFKGYDDDYTYIIRNTNIPFQINGPERIIPNMPVANLYGADVIVNMCDGSVWKDRSGDMKKRKYLPFPNRVAAHKV